MHMQFVFKGFLFLTVCGGLCILPKKTEAQSVTQAGKTITGKVTGDNGIGLASASVIVKGTPKGTTTDSTGSFTINVPDKNATLIFSHLNYINKEIKVGDASTVNVQLTP